MKRRLVLYATVVCVAAGVASAHWIVHRAYSIQDESSPRSDANLSPNARARKLLLQYCGSCHEHERVRNSFSFDATSLELSEMQHNHAAWELALRRLRSGKMPPRTSTQLPAEDKEWLLQWLEKTISQFEIKSGHYLTRRLQRSEYLHTVRDLFGVPIQEIDGFPEDSTAWEPNDNIPALSSTLQEQYRQIAKKVLTQVLGGDCNGMEEDDSSATPDEASAVRPRLRFVELPGKSRDDAAHDIIASISRRAYRGSVETEELGRLMKVFASSEESGASFEEGIGAALEEILVSPRFLYRAEARDERHVVPATAPRCSEEELASRLSFFLWGRGPDDELLEHARRGTLRDNLDTQVKRLLRDRRARTLANGFADHWLGLAKLDSRGFVDAELRRDMRLETQTFVAAIVREDRSVFDLLDADFAFVNERLAEHYGIPAVQGVKIRRVSLSGGQRGGILTQGSFLTITSKSKHATSPVTRGKWVLDNVLGEPPAPPPAGVDTMGELPSQPANILLRDPSCAQCHVKMDPIGYALENFDGAGQWRQTDHANAAIVPIGFLPDGQKMDGPAGLKAYLAQHRGAYVRVLSENLLSYSQGRRLKDWERQSLADIAEMVEPSSYSFSSLILEVVRSAPFQMGQREPEVAGKSN